MTEIIDSDCFASTCSLDLIQPLAVDVAWLPYLIDEVIIELVEVNLKVATFCSTEKVSVW